MVNRFLLDYYPHVSRDGRAVPSPGTARFRTGPSLPPSTPVPAWSSGGGTLLPGSLHHDRRAVAEDFGDALGDLGGVVAHADDRVGADGGGVLCHDVERFLAGVLA